MRVLGSLVGTCAVEELRQRGVRHADVFRRVDIGELVGVHEGSVRCNWPRDAAHREPQRVLDRVLHRVHGRWQLLRDERVCGRGHRQLQHDKGETRRRFLTDAGAEEMDGDAAVGEANRPHSHSQTPAAASTASLFHYRADALLREVHHELHSGEHAADGGPPLRRVDAATACHDPRERLEHLRVRG
ncbi:hypothetical protein ON010_g13228 [Phytophthora cinnamomi]|nr:hypothetical protein ON010_g13228 [Phytophthora cinnamomi]